MMYLSSLAKLWYTGNSLWVISCKSWYSPRLSGYFSDAGPVLLSLIVSGCLPTVISMICISFIHTVHLTNNSQSFIMFTYPSNITRSPTILRNIRFRIMISIVNKSSSIGSLEDNSPLLKHFWRYYEDNCIKILNEIVLPLNTMDPSLPRHTGLSEWVILVIL